MEAVEDFQIEGIDTKKFTNTKTKSKNKPLPVIQFGYGKTNPNIVKKSYSKKKKR